MLFQSTFSIFRDPVYCVFCFPSAPLRSVFCFTFLFNISSFYAASHFSIHRSHVHIHLKASRTSSNQSSNNQGITFEGKNILQPSTSNLNTVSPYAKLPLDLVESQLSPHHGSHPLPLSLWIGQLTHWISE